MNSPETPRRLFVLGSTGSIGRQTLDVVSAHPGAFQVVGLAAGTNVDGLVAQGQQFDVAVLGLADETAGRELRRSASAATIGVGTEGICGLVRDCRPDLVVAAASGVAGLAPILTALDAGISVAIANKEPLVAAGELVTTAAGRSGAQLVPIDSEISAVFQCLEGRPRAHLQRVILTASGGAFRDLSSEKLAEVTPQMALAHPTWNMGPKITVDSATLANKGFEVFELKWLFELDFSQIDILIHHQSVIHSMVEFVDGSTLAQLTLPDMRFAIQYALTWPERKPNELPRLDLAQMGELTFAAPNFSKFPCLRLAYEAGESGRSYPAALNAANEKSVELFLEGRIGFMHIPELVERTLEAHDPVDIISVETVAHADAEARAFVQAAAQSL